MTPSYQDHSHEIPWQLWGMSAPTKTSNNTNILAWIIIVHTPKVATRYQPQPLMPFRTDPGVYLVVKFEIIHPIHKVQQRIHGCQNMQMLHPGRDWDQGQAAWREVWRPSPALCWPGWSWWPALGMKRETTSPDDKIDEIIISNPALRMEKCLQKVKLLIDSTTRWIYKWKMMEW